MRQPRKLAATSSRRRETPDVRREQILDAAVEVLLERGLAAATMADVAEAAGVAKGTIYLYFESRTELLAALRSRHVDRFCDALGIALSGPGRARPATRLDRFIQEFFGYSLAHRRIHRLLFHEAGFSEDDAFAGVRTQLAEFIAAAIANSVFAHADVDLLTDYLLSGIHGALVAALHATDHDTQHYLRGAKELSQRLVQPQE
jgi:TetR/AcrR family transcriptional regulator, transcriptional repressor for nem operon